MSDTDARPRPPVAAFDLRVARVERLSATFLRLTLTGPDLAGFADVGPLGPRDLRVKLVVGGTGPSLRGGLEDGWYREWLARPEEDRGRLRTYTVRAVRLDGPEPELDIDFALHPAGPGGLGPATRWAMAARPGARVVLLGPAGESCEGYGGIEWAPPAYDGRGRSPRLLLLGDETAVPAVCSILESLPDDAVGHAVLEVPHAGDALAARTPAGVEVRWLVRVGERRGEPTGAAVRELLGDPLPRTVRCSPPEVDIDTGILWERSGEEPVAPRRGQDGPGWYAWVAGEAAMVRSLRRRLVGEHGLDRSLVAFMGYWRQGRSGA